MLTNGLNENLEMKSLTSDLQIVLQKTTSMVIIYFFSCFGLVTVTVSCMFC